MFVFMSGTVVAPIEAVRTPTLRDLLINAWTHIAQLSAGIVFRFWPNLVPDWKMLSATRRQFVRHGSKGELGKQSEDPAPSRVSEV